MSQEKKLLVFGHARSGTSILCDLFNNAHDVHLLSEANLWQRALEPNFVKVFNQQHRTAKTALYKSTYCPEFINKESNGLDCIKYLLGINRYAGEKIAYRKANGYCYDIIVKFLINYYQGSNVVFVFRDPIQTILANFKLFSTIDNEKNLYYECISYLESMLVMFSTFNIFKTSNFVNIGRLDEKTIEALNTNLDLNLANDGYLSTDRPNKYKTDLPKTDLLDICEYIYNKLNDSINVENLQINNHLSFRDMMFHVYRTLRDLH